MKNLIIQIALTVLIAVPIQLFFPWWSLAVVAGLIGFAFNYKYSGMSFLGGFIALFILWAGFALYIYYNPNGMALPNKIGGLFGGLGGVTLALVSGIIGGLVAGFAALTGTLGRRLIAAS